MSSVRSARAGRALRCLVLAGLLTGGLAGCSGSEGSEGPGSGSSGSRSSGAQPSGSQSGPSSGGGSGSPSGSSPSSPAASSASVRHGLRALGTASGAVRGGAAYDLEHGEDGGRTWEVKVARGGAEWKVRVRDDGTRALSRHRASSPDDDAGKLKGTRISAREAVRTVAERRAGAELFAAEIDRNRRGKAVWQVTTGNPRVSTLIDARTGRLLSERQDEGD